MLFSEKLAKLRKANGMSQEDLANRLQVSRQAVSKWENDQGYPEMEKLLMMGNLFQVSMDYLLKEEPSKQSEQESGYYVSREAAQGYLVKERKDTIKVAIAVLLFICSGVPEILVPTQEGIMSILTMVMITIGVILLTVLAMQNDPYSHITKEPLLFDRNVLKELKNEYARMYRRYICMIVIGLVMIFGGLIFTIYLDDVMGLNDSPLEGIFLLLVGCAVYLFIYAGSLSSSYEILVENEKYHMNKKKGNVIYAYTIGIACLIYVALGLYYGKAVFKTLWIIIPIVAILTAMFQHFINHKQR